MVNNQARIKQALENAVNIAPEKKVRSVDSKAGQFIDMAVALGQEISPSLSVVIEPMWRERHGQVLRETEVMCGVRMVGWPA